MKEYKPGEQCKECGTCFYKELTTYQKVKEEINSWIFILTVILLPLACIKILFFI